MVGTGPWMLALLTFVAVALGTVALTMVVEWGAARRRHRNLASQLNRLSTEGMESAVPGSGTLFRGAQGAELALVQQLSARVPQLRDMKHVLEQADLPWTVQTYLLLSAGIGTGTGSALLLFTGAWLPALIALLVGGSLPHLYVLRRRTRRMKRFEELFPSTVELLGRAIRAGHPFASGMKMVAEEMAEPVGGEFRRTFEEQRYGLPFEDSLTALADRVPLVDVRIFVTAILIQREVGGNLAEILDNLAEIIRQRFTLQRQVRTLTAEGRMSMYVLTAMPFAVGAFVLMSNPDYVKVLFEHPIGNLMVGAALFMQVVGFLWMRSITNIEF
jgi:tight adherence protein B